MLNSSLREQLEESHSTNEALTNDLQKLTNDWEALREEMIIKEDEWKDEEQAFNDYYSTEHNRLLNLWRDVVSVKRLFMDVQGSTERDMIKLKQDISGVSKEMMIACSRMDTNMFTENILGVSTFNFLIYSRQFAPRVNMVGVRKSTVLCMVFSHLKS